MKGLFKAFRNGGSPIELLGATLEGLPEEQQFPARELLEILAGSSIAGPAVPPPWLASVFHAAGKASKLSPELLAAVSWTLSRFDPRLVPGAPGVGIMGLPMDALVNPADLCATVEELEANDPRAVRAVWYNVHGAARIIAGQRKIERRGVVGALALYAPADHVPAIIGAYVLYLGRYLAPSRARELEEVTHGK